MSAWADMEHDLLPLGPMTLREKVKSWAMFYWRPTKGWMPKVEGWWLVNVRRFPPLPPIEKDRVAHHFGFVEGVSPCTDGPVCAEHGWRPSPLAGREAT